MPSTVRIRILEARGLISPNYVSSGNTVVDNRGEDYPSIVPFYNISNSGNTSTHNQPHTPRFSHGNPLTTTTQSLVMTMPGVKERQDYVNQNSSSQQIFQPFSSPLSHSLNSQSNSSAIETFQNHLALNNTSLYASSGDVSVDIKFAGNEQRTSVSKRNVGTFREYQMKQDHLQPAQQKEKEKDKELTSTTDEVMQQTTTKVSSNEHSMNTSNIIDYDDSILRQWLILPLDEVLFLHLLLVMMEKEIL